MLFTTFSGPRILSFSPTQARYFHDIFTFLVDRFFKYCASFGVYVDILFHIDRTHISGLRPLISAPYRPVILEVLLAVHSYISH